jgi:hypothetical protein
MIVHVVPVPRFAWIGWRRGHVPDWLAAFLAGRYSRAPQERVVTKDKIVTQVQTVEKIRTVTVHDVAEAKAAEVRTVTVTKYRWLPGGGAEAETTTTKQADTHETKLAHAGATQEAAKASRAATVELHTVERVPVLPQWSVSLMPGVDLRGNSSLPYHAVVGASVERRIIGPIFVGLWGNTAGAAGVTVKLER